MINQDNNQGNITNNIELKLFNPNFFVEKKQSNIMIEIEKNFEEEAKILLVEDDPF